jgi:hypothetical protein
MQFLTLTFALLLVGLRVIAVKDTLDVAASKRMTTIETPIAFFVLIILVVLEEEVFETKMSLIRPYFKMLHVEARCLIGDFFVWRQILNLQKSTKFLLKYYFVQKQKSFASHPYDWG